MLGTVAFSWQQDVLTEDAKLTFDLSRGPYSRLAALAGHVEKLGRSLESTVKNYNGFVALMERQVLSGTQTQQLDESTVLGPLAAIEDSSRELRAMELVAEVEAQREAD